jgi:hypothetical protein
MPMHGFFLRNPPHGFDFQIEMFAAERTNLRRPNFSIYNLRRIQIEYFEDLGWRFFLGALSFSSWIY